TASAPASRAARTCSAGSRYEAISITWSAVRACNAPRSSGATTATDSIPSLVQVRKMRTAISPRFATMSRRTAMEALYAAGARVRALRPWVEEGMRVLATMIAVLVVVVAASAASGASGAGRAGPTMLYGIQDDASLEYGPGTAADRVAN